MSTTGAGVRRVALDDSRSVHIRPVAPEDLEGIRALFAQLPPDDRRRRFFAWYEPTEAFYERLVHLEDEGGYELVATVGDGDTRAVIGEAGYELLADGDGELAITVAPAWRGWLGHALLDALVEAAAARGVPNLQADVLSENLPMLALARARGYATLDHDGFTTVRVTIGTSGPVPTWPDGHERLRLLVEAPGGRWRGEAAARAAGFQVLVCPGPARRPGPTSCPLLRGEPCPLVSGADAVVCALRPEDASTPRVLEGQRDLHPGRPVVVDRPPAPVDEVLLELRRDLGPLSRGADSATVGPMGEHADDREALEFGGEAPTVEVVVYQDGKEIHRELCESTEAAADVVERWNELDGVECVVDDLSVHHGAGQILEPEEEATSADDVYPRAPGPTGG